MQRLNFVFLKLPQVPNSSPTAASASSDMYGGAVLDACEQIKARMKPIAEKSTSMTFAEARICYSSNRIFVQFSALHCSQLYDVYYCQ